MSIQAVADTHAIVWYLFNDRRLSPQARDLIEATAASGNQIEMSSISLAEIIYLIERGRIRQDALLLLFSELDHQPTALQEVPSLARWSG